MFAHIEVTDKHMGQVTSRLGKVEAKTKEQRTSINNIQKKMVEQEQLMIKMEANMVNQKGQMKRMEEKYDLENIRVE